MRSSLKNFSEHFFYHHHLSVGVFTSRVVLPGTGAVVGKVEVIANSTIDVRTVIGSQWLQA